MTIRTAETSPLAMARLAGFLYVLTVPLAVFALLVVPSKVIVLGDAAATAEKIMASESLFRLGIASALLARSSGYCTFSFYTGCSNPLTKTWQC